MPIFDYKCSFCRNTIKDLLVDKSDELVFCKCGLEMEKDYSTINVIVRPDIEPHYNPSLGMWIKSRRDLREKLWLTNSRTDDITPVGGLVPEEREILRGNNLESKIIKPTEPLPDGTIELKPVEVF